MSWLDYGRRLVAANNLPLLVALFCLFLAVFMPSISVEQPVYRVQVTFDISQSMNVQDVPHESQVLSRLEFAKLAAQQLVNELPCGSYIGWSVFTGRKILTLITPVEVCAHYAGLLSSLTEINGRMRWLNGSAIGKGLHQSIRAADGFTEKTAVVFISDGHEAPPLEPGQRGMPKTDKFSVAGLIAGVGGDIPVPIPKTDNEGNVIGYWKASDVVQLPPGSGGRVGQELSYRDDAQLQGLARLTGFSYWPLTHPTSLSEALGNTSIASLQHSQRDFRWVAATLALLMLVWCRRNDG